MTRTRELGRHQLLDVNDTTIEIDAVLLGEGSSWAEGKTRWFEVKIFADENDEYVVHTVGKSTNSGERDLGRVWRTPSPYDVVEILTVRRVSSRQADPRTGNRRTNAYVPNASARALAQAAEFDDGLHDVYLRMVA